MGWYWWCDVEDVKEGGNPFFLFYDLHDIYR
jgi:hypothetical protein